LPALLVIGTETYSYIRELGSWCNVSVERLGSSGKKPDLAFMAPTCLRRDSSLFPHGKVGHLISHC